MDRLTNEIIKCYIRWTLLLIKYSLLINFMHLTYLVLFVNFTCVDYHFQETIFIDRKICIQIWKKNSFICLFVWNPWSFIHDIVHNKIRRWEIYLFSLYVCSYLRITYYYAFHFYIIFQNTHMINMWTRREFDNNGSVFLRKNVYIRNTKIV